MYLIIWRFEPRAGRLEEFEAAYAPDGPWGQLFRKAEGYLGTELLRDSANPDGYLTLDKWRTEVDFEHFKQTYGTEYEALDRQLEGLTSTESKVGTFLSMNSGFYSCNHA
jgi:heme-degrading monooxygenase HmoA